MIHDLERALGQLEKVTPPKAFFKSSKERLLHRMVFTQNERWFKAFLKRTGEILMRASFLIEARVRLLESIQKAHFHHGWLVFFRRLAASTLIMIFAVTSTLFYIDGSQLASASQDTHLEVLQGEVTLKRADRITWETVLSSTEVMAGDLVRLGEGAEATIHFFDDTDLRLTDHALLLLTKITPSPVFARQGIIEVSLHQGHAWVQTLNVDDGVSGLTLVTRDAILSALRGSFDVTTRLYEPTRLRVFSNQITVKPLHPLTQEVRPGVVLQSNQTLTINRHPTDLRDLDRQEVWVGGNLERDREHLARLRDREFANLEHAVGVLPGTMLYPLKLAKERLQLAFSFGDQDLTQTQIELANKRLNEAMVLLQKGDRINAQQALLAYKDLTQAITDKSSLQPLLVSNKKALVAALPLDPPVRLVNEALNQTEELIAQDPLEREQVRLKNSLEGLTQISDLIALGDFEQAKEALAAYRLNPSGVLEQAAALENAEEQKMILTQVLDSRKLEAQKLEDLLTSLAKEPTTDIQLLAMVEQASSASEVAVRNTLAALTPLGPKLVKKPAPVLLPDPKVQAFTDRLLIYKTWQGQKNQLTRLLRERPKYSRDIKFLIQVRGLLPDIRTQNLIDNAILEAQGKERLQKHRETKIRIDRAKQTRLEQKKH